MYYPQIRIVKMSVDAQGNAEISNKWVIHNPIYCTLVCEN